MCALAISLGLTLSLSLSFSLSLSLSDLHLLLSHLLLSLPLHTHMLLCLLAHTQTAPRDPGLQRVSLKAAVEQAVQQTLMQDGHGAIFAHAALAAHLGQLALLTGSRLLRKRIH